MRNLFSKFMMTGAIFAAALLVAPAIAQQNEVPLDEQNLTEPIQPPENNDSVVATDKTLERLFELLKKDAKTESAKATARQIWREWAHSGNRSVDLLMEWAAASMRGEEYSRAQDLLDQVVVIAPQYAEGWNRRATLHFYMQDFSRSISDIETTLRLEPRHFGALSGLAAIMQRLDRDEEALKAWYKVLEIYPANKQAQESVIKLEEKLSGSRT